MKESLSRHTTTESNNFFFPFSDERNPLFDDFKKQLERGFNYEVEDEYEKIETGDF